MFRPLAIVSLMVFGQFSPSTPYGRVTATFYPATPAHPWAAPPRPPNSLEVFRGAPARPAREVGWVHAESLLGYALGVQMVVGTAAEHGCDAVGNLTSRLGVGGTPGGGSFMVQGGLGMVEEIDGTCYTYAPEK
ncbi:MAG: hypothetical protein ACYCWW_05710 [Deltaproteobacteria bacterium]